MGMVPRTTPQQQALPLPMARTASRSSIGAMSSERTPTPWYRQRLWHIQPLRDVATIIAILLLLRLGEAMSVVTVPLLLGLGLAYVLEPMVRFLEKRSRWLTRTRIVVILMGMVIGGAVALVVVAVPVAYRQAKDLWQQRATLVKAADQLATEPRLPDFARSYVQTTNAFLHSALLNQEQEAAISTSAPVSRPTSVSDDNDEARIRRIVSEELDRRADDAAREASPDLAGYLAGIASTIGNVVGWVVMLFLTGFFALIWSLSFPAVLLSGERLIPDRYRDDSMRILAQMDAAVSGFVRGRLTIAAILVVHYCIGWWLCGIPGALLLGVATGILTIIPYASALGTVVAYALLIAQILAGTHTGSFYHDAAGAVVWWRVLVIPALVPFLSQILDDYILTPTIQGKATKLSMPMIVAAVVAGGSLGGLFGMLLAIPVAACARILITELLWPRIRSWLDGERKDPLPLD
jgi:predicted PurR-regulated permease PerM